VLCRLFIQNIALFEQLELSFGPGLNVITGETGAGKTILIDALMLALGERGGADILRQGASKGIVEATFRLEPHGAVSAFVREQGYDSDNEELVIRREITARGGSRCFLNDSPAPLSLVRQLSRLLVDFHGQHEQQSLLRVETHGRLLDNVGGLEGLRQEYTTVYEQLQKAIHEYHTLCHRERQVHQQREWLRRQVQEIVAIDPQPGEEEAVERELRLSEHAERLYALAQQVYELLYRDEHAVHDRLLRVRNLLEELSRIDSRFTDSAAEARAWVIAVEELVRTLQRYMAHLEFEPERLEQLRQRMVQLQQLRKRYGSVEAALEQKRRWEEELQEAEQFEFHLQRARQAIERYRAELARYAQRLHAKRKAVAEQVERAVEELLAELGIPYSQFVVHIGLEEAAAEEELWVELQGQRYRAFPHGVEQIEFLITTNRGEPPRPLVRVASGGEISRIMLALKSVLAKSERLPLLVFDEIDTGISGRIAHRVGQALRALAQYHQVLVITHLPQIAACGDEHILVEKREWQDRTVVTARRLQPEERAYEVARLLSGERVTETALQTARELLAEHL